MAFDFQQRASLSLLSGSRRVVPGWRGNPAWRVSDNGNKDHQNNNETDENDDYEYKIANQDDPSLPPSPLSLLSPMSMSPEKADSAEINDMVAIRRKRSNGESSADKDAAAEKKSTLGWMKRKLLSIEGDSAGVDRDDTESDYKADNRRKAGYAGEFTRERGPYRNEGDDYRDKQWDDYYHKSGGSHADISGLSRFTGAVPLNRYAADVGDMPTYWNKPNHKRESVREMNGRVDSRNDDKATVFNRKRESLKPVGGGTPSSETSSSQQETTQDQETVYRQQYDDADDVDGTTPCDCVAKCATSESTTDEVTEESETLEPGEINEEETTEVPEEEQHPEEGKAEEKEDHQEEDDQNTQEAEKEPSTEENEQQPQEEEPHPQEEAAKEESETNRTKEQDHEKEIYIDLKIGIKSIGNRSSSAQEEPIEFHRKIVVKREEFENDMSSKMTSSLAAPSKFPVDLVKAIYQLVDKDDSLRKHVAPRLPDRTKLLSKLEQPGRRQKINDRQLESTSGGEGGGHPKALAKIEENASSNKALAGVIEAIGELIRKRM